MSFRNTSVFSVQRKRGKGGGIKRSEKWLGKIQTKSSAFKLLMDKIWYSSSQLVVVRDFREQRFFCVKYITLMVPAVSIVEDDLYAGAEDMTVRACVEQLLPLLLVEGLVLHTSLRHEIQEGRFALSWPFFCHWIFGKRVHVMYICDIKSMDYGIWHGCMILT